MNERIDLLAVLNTAERSIIGAGSSEFRPAMREAIAAVAELIEADRELDSAQAALTDDCVVGEERYHGEFWDRYKAARDRRAAALARVGGSHE